MATHASILAWKVPWTAEPGGLQSMVVTKSWTQFSDCPGMHASIGTISGSLASSLGVLIAGGK